MDNAFRLFRLRGIDVYIHVTFPLILLWAGLFYGWLQGRGLSGAVFGVVVTLLLFVIVLLHEFGHGLAAQAYGVEVKRIVLLPLGGVAQLGRIPEKPMQEFVIAIAGPMVNFVLAVVMLPLAVVFLPELSDLGLRNALRQFGQLTGSAIYQYLFVSNIFLAVFNLVPAFPLDGGRVLRALLAARMDYAKATRIAVWIGQSLAWGLGLWGFASGNLFSILIALFIYMGAGAEGQMIALRVALNGLVVEQAYSRQAMTVTPQQTVGDAAQLVLQSFQSNFAVCENGELVGVLPYGRLVEALEKQGRATVIGEVMEREAVSVRPQDKLFQVQEQMMLHNREALPVAEAGRYLGLISRGDIAEAVRLLTILKRQQ